MKNNKPKRPTACPVCGSFLGIEQDDVDVEGNVVVIFSCPEGHSSILLREDDNTWKWI